MRAREAAYQVLCEIEEGAYANIVLDDYLSRNSMGGKDRALVTEIVYGTVKYRSKLDWIIKQLVTKEKSLERRVLILLRLSFYQLVFLDRVPPPAVTDESVKIAKKYFHSGVAGLVNAVLRNYLRAPHRVSWPKEEEDPVAYLEVFYSHPGWLVKRWLARYGYDKTKAFCEFNNKPAPLSIRVNTLKTTAALLKKQLLREGLEVEKSRFVSEGIILKNAPSLASLPSFQQGLFTVQDESSMLAAYALAPRPGQNILDVCAGPGGKTTHLAQMMANTGSITACDIHEHRLSLVEENAARLGINIIKTRLQDAAQLRPDSGEYYDHVLVDAPCSGLGVLRRRPDLRWRKKESDIKELAELQYQIITAALGLLKPGGRLVYSTCTVEPEENQDLIRKLKRGRTDISGYSLAQYLPQTLKLGRHKAELAEGMIQLLPFTDETEGFFIAGLTKQP